MNHIDQLLPSLKHPVAAFDADGTLWDIDMGETFFQYQIDHKLVELPSDPWHHYHSLKKKNPPDAYLWLAQINKGKSLGEVRRWAKEAVDEIEEVPFFPEIRQLIQFLLSKKVSVYVVTASIKWSVEPAARLLGVPFTHVLGVETEVDAEDLITDHQKGVVTYRHGKPEALLEATGGVHPFLCVGNTEGDQKLLESATDLKLCVRSAEDGSELGFSEEKLWSWGEHHDAIRWDMR